MMNLARLGIFGLVGLSLAAFVERGLWWLGLLVHGRLIFGLGLVALALVVGRKEPRWAIAALVGSLLNLGLVGLSWQPVEEPAGSHPIISILHSNIDRHNPDPERILPLVEGERPDLLLLQEVTPENLAILESSLVDYRLVQAEPRENSHGSAIFEADGLGQPLIFRSSTIHLPPEAERPLIWIQFELEEQPVSLLYLHTTRPRSRWTAASQAVELAAVAEWSRTQQAAGNAVIIIGDFNTTP